MVLPDDRIPMAHWRSDADIRVIPMLSASVTAFAADRGMTLDAQEDLSATLGQALLRAVDDARAARVPPRIKVDAATDGAWLSVRIADRVPEDAVFLEFAMHAER
jgi:hypothetical protein